MELTKTQCELLGFMINGSIMAAQHSGIPIERSVARDIDSIKNKLELERIEAIKREGKNN